MTEPQIHITSHNKVKGNNSGDSEEELTLYAVKKIKENTPRLIMVPIDIKGKEIPMEVGTEAGVSIIPLPMRICIIRTYPYRVLTSN